MGAVGVRLVDIFVLSMVDNIFTSFSSYSYSTIGDPMLSPMVAVAKAFVFIRPSLYLYLTESLKIQLY